MVLASVAVICSCTVLTLFWHICADFFKQTLLHLYLCGLILTIFLHHIATAVAVVIFDGITDLGLALTKCLSGSAE